MGDKSSVLAVATRAAATELVSNLKCTKTAEVLFTKFTGSDFTKEPIRDALCVLNASPYRLGLLKAERHCGATGTANRLWLAKQLDELPPNGVLAFGFGGLSEGDGHRAVAVRLLSCELLLFQSNDMGNEKYTLGDFLAHDKAAESCGARLVPCLQRGLTDGAEDTCWHFDCKKSRTYAAEQIVIIMAPLKL